MNGLADEISRAAHIVARKWADVIDADDAGQEIWVRLLERDYIRRLDEMDAPARARTLVRIGEEIASQYRNDHEVFSGNVCYGTDEVRVLLKSGLLVKQRGDIDAASETLTEFIDLHEGSGMLRESQPHHAEVIGAAYVFGDEQQHPQTVSRAIDALTRCMNRVHTTRYSHEGPGSRRAVANSAARAATD